MARPRIEIDKKIFEGLCAIQCTEEEIIAVLDCSLSTLKRFCKREYGESFEQIFKEKKKKGLVSLRRMQWKSAEKGNVTMQIFLGKQLLNQKENPTITASGDGKIELIIN